MSPRSESGADGKPTVSWLESGTTPSSLLYPVGPSSSSFAPSSDSTELLAGVPQEAWKADIASHWSRALSELPQAVWLRRFGTISNQAPFTSREARTFTQP